jgi:hypothetical protein
MILEFDTGRRIEKPSANQIEEAVGDLSNRKDSFVVLSSTSTDFVQVAAGGNAGFTVEYQEGDRTRHFRANEKLAHSRVVDVLVRYSRGDAQWKASLSWKQAAGAAGRTTLLTASLALWVVGIGVMLPALFFRNWWVSRLVGVGCAVVSLGCVANIISGILHQRMWVRHSIMTPDGFGGVMMFRVFVFLYALLAVVFALAGARFGWPITS